MRTTQHRQIVGRAAVALWVAGVALTWGTARAQPGRDLVQIDDLRKLESAFVELADRVRPTAVSIRTYNLSRLVVQGESGPEETQVRMPRSHGSGAIIRHDGYILTSAHVIEGANEIVVILHDGQELEANLVQADQRSDLAVLKVDTAGLRPVTMGDHEGVRQGQWCFAVGNPFGVSNTRGRAAMTYGIVSALGQDLTSELNPDAGTADQRYYGNLIQTSAAINPGNSGGPLFDIDGRMIGVVTAIESRSGVTEGCGFAIPLSERNRKIIEELEAGRPVKYGYLGIEFDPRDTFRRSEQRGVRIERLSPTDGPAAQAGLRPDDIIVEIDGVPIHSKDQLVRLVGAAPVGSKTRVAYLRDGQPGSVIVTMGERPVNPVPVGTVAAEESLRTCQWRGAWLQEPTDAMLKLEGLSRDSAGLAVVLVEAGSDADQAGLEPAQMILSYDRQRVRTIEEFLAADRQAGSTTRLRVHTESGVRILRMPDREPSL